MILKTYSELPALEIEPASDCSFISHTCDGKTVLTVAYATKRDFLSVPKTYTVVEFRDSDKGPLEFHCLDREEYLEQMELANSWFKPGIYELDKGKDYTIILLLTHDRALEIIFAKASQRDDVYHSVDAQSALLDALRAS